MIAGRLDALRKAVAKNLGRISVLKRHAVMQLVQVVRVWDRQRNWHHHIATNVERTEAFGIQGNRFVDQILFLLCDATLEHAALFIDPVNGLDLALVGQSSDAFDAQQRFLPIEQLHRLVVFCQQLDVGDLI